MSDSQESCYQLYFPQPGPCLQGTQVLLHCNNSPEKSDRKVHAVLNLCAKTGVKLKKKLKLNGRNRRKNSMSKIKKKIEYGTIKPFRFPGRWSAQKAVILCSQLQRLQAYSTCLCSVIDRLPKCPCTLCDIVGEGKHQLERSSHSSDGTAAADVHFNCLEARISRTTLKIHCTTCILNLVMLVTLIRSSLATRGDMYNVFKAENHIVRVQERNRFQRKACISASQANWRLMVLKPLCLSFLSLLRISQSEKTEYHFFKLKAHFKWTCCDGRIFHHAHAGHKICDWLQFQLYRFLQQI